jgi:hypothetical protein
MKKKMTEEMKKWSAQAPQAAETGQSNAATNVS